MSEINVIGLRLNEKSWSGYYDFSDEDRISFELYGCNKSNEGLSITADVDLLDRNGWKYGREKQEKRLLEALSRFKDILVKVESGLIDLEDPIKVWDDNELQWDGGYKTQLKLYDYELSC